MPLDMSTYWDVLKMYMLGKLMFPTDKPCTPIPRFASQQVHLVVRTLISSIAEQAIRLHLSLSVRYASNLRGKIINIFQKKKTLL